VSRITATEQWLVARTSSIADWPAHSLVRDKGAHRVAVVLPARDEEARVGDIVEAIISSHCRGPRPLVDEVVVVDSRSQDATADVAARAGARVVAAPEPGKGEAMWHGLAATSADLVAFIDADLERFDPMFVPALVGPMLHDADVHFVKATYDRPVGQATAVGGGRVTELMARPLLSAFWPELAGVLQPLSGEYAARRTLLERLPFRRGYGVDIALLLESYGAVGLDGIAQVDLHERYHRHSDLASLGRMAAEVMHAVLDRLAADGRIPCDLELSTLLAQPTRVSGGLRIATHDVEVSERPPLAMLDVADALGERTLTQNA
jgi:glucosyl-3-phosphoglycerate synthase